MIVLERPNEVEIADEGRSDDDLAVECSLADGFSGVTRSGGRIFLTFTKDIDIETALSAIALPRIPTGPAVET